jgi:hypothetical protein
MGGMVLIICRLNLTRHHPEGKSAGDRPMAGRRVHMSGRDGRVSVSSRPIRAEFS